MYTLQYELFEISCCDCNTVLMYVISRGTTVVAFFQLTAMLWVSIGLHYLTAQPRKPTTYRLKVRLKYI